MQRSGKKCHMREMKRIKVSTDAIQFFETWLDTWLNLLLVLIIKRFTFNQSTIDYSNYR